MKSRSRGRKFNEPKDAGVPSPLNRGGLRKRKEKKEFSTTLRKWCLKVSEFFKKNSLPERPILRKKAKEKSIKSFLKLYFLII